MSHSGLYTFTPMYIFCRVSCRGQLGDLSLPHRGVFFFLAKPCVELLYLPLTFSLTQGECHFFLLVISRASHSPLWMAAACSHGADHCHTPVSVSLFGPLVFQHSALQQKSIWLNCCVLSFFLGVTFTGHNIRHRLYK